MRRKISGQASLVNSGARAGGILAAAGLMAIGVIAGASIPLPMATAARAVQPDPAEQPLADPAAELTPPTRGPEGIEIALKMLAGLKASEGCFGAEMGRMMSGKNSIFAWFENKAAVKEWYYGAAHERLLDGVMPADEPLDHEPLAFVEDETIPIMVVMTITFADTPQFEAIKMPISQVSVELFAALPGGVQLGGRLSPESFVVPHMVDLGK